MFRLSFVTETAQVDEKWTSVSPGLRHLRAAAPTRVQGRKPMSSMWIVDLIATFLCVERPKCLGAK